MKFYTLAMRQMILSCWMKERDICIRLRRTVSCFLMMMMGTPLAIDTMIQIGYDGKILIGEDSSYEQQDKNNYGNILQKHISTLLAEGAFDEPLTEDEAHMRDTLYTLYKNEEFTDMSKETMQHILATYEFVYCAKRKIP